MQTKKTVVYLSADAVAAAEFQRVYAEDLTVLHISSAPEMLALCKESQHLFEAIFVAAPLSSSLGIHLTRVMKKEMVVKHPIFWLAEPEFTPAVYRLLLLAGVADILLPDADQVELLTRLHLLNQPVMEAADLEYSFRKTPGKRIFDIVCAGAALLALSPLMLLVAALVKLESKGPVFYYSYRVGTGYKVFRFWKFRSMRQDADQLLASMKDLNQYTQAAAPVVAVSDNAAVCAACAAAGTQCQSMLCDEKRGMICERQYRLEKQADADAAFVKIANDPRITRIGRLLRNTSIDELPQLYNVLRGDMAIVGNRPLPLYEAEKLMTDQFAGRFVAPAGITGLWQVSKRGKGGDMSEDERKALDNEYAQHYSLKTDLEIILRTIPALFQKENV